MSNENNQQVEGELPPVVIEDDMHSNEEVAPSPELTGEAVSEEPVPLSEVSETGAESVIQEEEEAPLIESDWREALGEYKDSPSLQDFKTPEDLAKSYVSAQKMLGNSLRIPSDEADQETWDNFYSKLDKVPNILRKPSENDPEALNSFYKAIGRPDSPEDYKLDIPEILKQSDPDSEETFRSLAYEYGLNQKQSEALVNFQVESWNKAQDMLDQRTQECTKTLRQEWGDSFDDRMKGVAAMVNKYKDQYPVEAQELVGGALGSNALVIKTLSELAKVYQEKGVDLPSSQPLNYGLTPDEASQRLNEIYENRGHPYHDRSHPDHNSAVERVSKYFAAGGKPKWQQ